MRMMLLGGKKKPPPDELAGLRERVRDLEVIVLHLAGKLGVNILEETKNGSS